METVLVNYKMGNIFSIEKKLKRFKTDIKVSSDVKDILNADKLILPGVGHFGQAMNKLKELDLISALNEAVHQNATPILGICLGMQLMTQGSDEGSSEGLGWFNCKTEKLKVNDPYRFKIPHTGWNTIEHDGSSPILENVPSGSDMYFVHAFGVQEASEDEILTRTTYENEFISGIAKRNVFGLQFHPEKSHDLGEQIFKNFIAI
jgi:glutamine amidotransferase